MLAIFVLHLNTGCEFCDMRVERKEFHFSLFWTLFFCLFWISVQGRYHLIGSSEPIVVAPGDDVILPCHVDPGWDAERKTVEWSKLDLRENTSDRQRDVEYVFVYRFQRPDQDVMMASYIQRTSLSSDGLKRGDVSLRIRNVTLEDGGRFRCFIPNLRIDAEVLLFVNPNVAVTTPSETPVFNRHPSAPDLQNESGRTARSRLGLYVVLSVCLSIVLVGLVWVRLLQKHEAPASDPESARLPCSTAENQPNNPDPTQT